MLSDSERRKNIFSSKNGVEPFSSPSKKEQRPVTISISLKLK